MYRYIHMSVATYLSESNMKHDGTVLTGTLTSIMAFHIQVPMTKYKPSFKVVYTLSM